MRIAKTNLFTKSYRKLPQHIQKKVDKQLLFLTQNISHPSLRVKRMSGTNRWEARIDRAYRFTFEKVDDLLIIRTVGPHDEGLGRK